MICMSLKNKCRNEGIRVMSNRESSDATKKARENGQRPLITVSVAIAIFLAAVSSEPASVGWLMTAVGLPTAHAQERDDAEGEEEEEEVAEPSLTTEDDDGESSVAEENVTSASETEEELYEVEPQRALMPAYEPSVTTEEDDPEEASVDSPASPVQPNRPGLGD